VRNQTKGELRKIAELCQVTGFTKPMIMHYLKLGLMPAPLKISPNLHLYDQSHVDALTKIAAFREEGLSLPQVKEALDSGREPSHRQSPSAPGSEISGDKGQKITEMAIRLFSKDGYENVKVSDITDALNIGKGTFYLYFANKRELLHNCFAHVQSLLIAAEGTEEIHGAPDLVNRMKNRWLYFQKHYPHFVGILQMLQTTTNSSDAEIRKMALKAFDSIIAPVREDLRQAQKEGAAPALDAELLAYSVIGIMEAVSFRMSQDTAYSLEATAQAISEMMERLLLTGSS